MTARLDRIVDAVLSDPVAPQLGAIREALKAARRAERLERLAEKWGARLVVSGRVVREGGAR